MNQEQFRKAMTTQFYHSLADSGVEISAVPLQQLQAIVNALADGAFAALTELLDEDGDTVLPSAATFNRPASAVAPDEVEETILWQGRPYLTIGTRYELTTQRLRIFHGVLGKRLEEIELVRVRDSKVVQNPAERALNIGDITILSNDPSTPESVLRNVNDPLLVREHIRNAMLAEKDRRGLHYREEM